MVKEDPRPDRLASMARAVGLFFSLYCVLGVLTHARHRTFDPNVWWLDLRRLPNILEFVFLIAFAGLVGTWSIRPSAQRVRKTATVGVLAAAILVSLINSVDFYRLLMTAQISTALPLPLSLLIAGTLAAILVAVSLRESKFNPTWGLMGLIACAALFPLTQMALFGSTDYRRRADAIVVFGARAYADGTPSDALADRTLTAIALYKQGHAPRLILSGGPGDGPVSEAQAMRNMALAAGVPAHAIARDESGWSTQATTANTRVILSDAGRPPRVLAVSHAWHLPRVKLRFAREGIEAYTVPADERGRPLKKTPLLMLRETPAFWLYLVRALRG